MSEREALTRAGFAIGASRFGFIGFGAAARAFAAYLRDGGAAAAVAVRPGVRESFGRERPEDLEAVLRATEALDRWCR